MVSGESCNKVNYNARSIGAETRLGSELWAISSKTHINFSTGNPRSNGEAGRARPNG